VVQQALLIAAVENPGFSSHLWLSPVAMVPTGTSIKFSEPLHPWYSLPSKQTVSYRVLGTVCVEQPPQPAKGCADETQIDGAPHALVIAWCGEGESSSKEFCSMHHPTDLESLSQLLVW